MEELLNHRIIDISAGDSHALALTHDSTVYAWGNNSVGQCGQVNVGQGSCRGGAVEGSCRGGGGGGGPGGCFDPVKK